MIPGTAGLSVADCLAMALLSAGIAYLESAQAELEMIVPDKRESECPQNDKARPRWGDLFKLPQTWGTIIAKLYGPGLFLHRGMVPDLPGGERDRLRAG